jgi:hypothetical protein
MIGAQKFVPSLLLHLKMLFVSVDKFVSLFDGIIEGCCFKC